jgi:catechol 2,3-dioxygenase-like lactoylglutathione lyase family enzyme
VVELGAVAHFSISVNDPAASAAWWTKHFNLEEFGRRDDRVIVGNDAIVIVLVAGKPDASGMTHLAFRARDLATLQAARDALRDGGVKLEDPGDEIGPVSPTSKSLGLWFHDPDGYRWELFVPG